MVSELILRKPVVVKHPRWLACAWFAGFGALSVVAWAALVMLFAVITQDETAGVYLKEYLLRGIVLGASAALLPGALLGADILSRERVRSVKWVIMRGAGIAAIAHVVSAIIIGVCTGYPMFAPIALVVGLVAFGWMTIPVGCAGGWLLWRSRQRLEGPVGCRLHGYRESARAES